MTQKKNESQAIGLQLAKDSNSELMKTYFAKVFELKQSGKEFPIYLDDVYPLVYERKEAAVKALKSDFVEGEDYVLLRQNGEQKKQPLRQNDERLYSATKGGGHNRLDYFLSVACMEYFIAKKVKPVFEVYRSVFHKTVEAKQEPRKISENATKVENVVFPVGVTGESIQCYFSEGIMYARMGSVIKYIDPRNSWNGYMKNKLGDGNIIIVNIGKTKVPFGNFEAFKNYVQNVNPSSFKRINAISTCIWGVDFSSSQHEPFAYSYTVLQMLEIFELITDKPIKKELVLEALKKGKLAGGNQ